MDIGTIRLWYDNGHYNFNMTIPEKVKENHVFDEELSVRRNREMAIEHNKKVDAMRKEKTEKQNELYRKLTNDVVQYIVESYDISEAQARIVERYVYTEKHSFMGDYFSAIDDVAQMVENVLNDAKLEYMDKIKEQTETIVELRVDVLQARLPDGCCPYRYFGNHTNKKVDCNEIGCDECKVVFFEDYEKEVRKEINKKP